MNDDDFRGFVDDLLDKGKIKFMAFEANKERDYLEKHREIFTLRPRSDVTKKFVATPVGYFSATKIAEVMPKYDSYKAEWVRKSGFGSKEEWDNELCERAKDYSMLYREPLIVSYNLYHLISIDRYLEGKDIPEVFVKKPFEKPK